MSELERKVNRIRRGNVELLNFIQDLTGVNRRNVNIVENTGFLNLNVVALEDKNDGTFDITFRFNQTGDFTNFLVDDRGIQVYEIYLQDFTLVDQYITGGPNSLNYDGNDDITTFTINVPSQTANILIADGGLFTGIKDEASQKEFDFFEDITKTVPVTIFNLSVFKEFAVEPLKGRDFRFKLLFERLEQLLNKSGNLTDAVDVLRAMPGKYEKERQAILEWMGLGSGSGGSGGSGGIQSPGGTRP